MKGFLPFPPRHGQLMDCPGPPHAVTLYAWSGGRVDLPDNATHFGFVQRGPATLRSGVDSFPLHSGMYFCSPGRTSIQGSGTGLIISHLGGRGFFLLGGPIEETGRLRYIDGCTDSLLVPPVLLGDPCLNLLHIPAHTRQTQHTHPSLRAGIIVSGRGRCVTPEAEFPLRPGLAFLIPAHERHSFHTDDEALRVIAYHPDSDFGPTHQNHPMLNRTVIRRPDQPAVTRP